MFRIAYLSIYMAFISIFATIISAETKNVVLQNGLGGYDGCVDSYVGSVGKKNDSTPKGDEDYLRIAE